MGKNERVPHVAAPPGQLQKIIAQNTQCHGRSVLWFNCGNENKMCKDPSSPQLHSLPMDISFSTSITVRNREIYLIASFSPSRRAFFVVYAWSRSNALALCFKKRMRDSGRRLKSSVM